MKPRVLIVGTVPYNKKSTSRAFESYFCNWEKENVAQIFSNTKCPTKGHCGKLFQITDQRLIKKRFNHHLDTGVIFDYNDLPDEWSDSSLEVNSSIFSKMYSWGAKKSPIVYLIRKHVWNKKYWCTDKLNQWLDGFNPQCVFLSFSDDFFILEIALYVANKYNIPIVSSIGDDYYFNSRSSLSPLYYIYKYQYRKLIEKVFRHKGSAIYIGDKIRDKYNSYFGLDGKTVYLTSSIRRREFKEIDVSYPKISYFGNIRLGRNYSLNDIGYALGKINPGYILDIYSNENDSAYFGVFNNNKNIRFHGSIPYSEVQRRTIQSDIVVVVEGFNKYDVEITRYSLSTKVADSLASGANILVYGSIECGAIEYLKNINSAAVCLKKEDLVECISNLFYDIEYQKRNYAMAELITQQHHNLEQSSAIFEEIVNKLVKENTKNMLHDKLTMMIQTCDKFSDLWDSHVFLLNNNWSDRNINTILVTDIETSKGFENVSVISAGNGSEFTQRLQFALNYVYTDYILITLDDYFLTSKINNNNIEYLINVMEKEKLDYIRMFQIPKPNGRFKNYKHIFNIDLSGNYKVNLYPGLWRKSFLKETLENPLNAWQYEVSLTKKALDLGALCVMTKGKEFEFLDVVRKGKLLHKANRYLRKNQLYSGHREVISWKQEIKLNLMFYGKEFIPQRFFKYVKRKLIKRGHKFYSAVD